MIKRLDRRQLAMMLNYIGMNNVINGINCLEDIYDTIYVDDETWHIFAF